MSSKQHSGGKREKVGFGCHAKHSVQCEHQGLGKPGGRGGTKVSSSLLCASALDLMWRLFAGYTPYSIMTIYIYYIYVSFQLT